MGTFLLRNASENGFNSDKLRFTTPWIRMILSLLGTTDLKCVDSNKNTELLCDSM